MRVAHLVDRTDAIGGVQTYLASLLPALTAHGIESVVVAGAGEGVPPGSSRLLHVAGIDAGGPALAPATEAMLDAVLAEAAPDVCYVHSAPSPGVVRAAARHAPVVLYAHDYAPVCPGNARYLHARRAFCSEGPGLRCFVRAYTERCTNRRPDRVLVAVRGTRAWAAAVGVPVRVFAASEFVAAVLTAGGFPRERVRVVPYVVDPVPAAEPRPGAADVLFVGRLTASKGVDVLLEALAGLPGVTLDVAGDGPDRGRLEALAGTLGSAGRTTFLGWTDPAQRPALLAGARAFVMPSLWDEPFGIAGVEALSAGVPVVASAVGGIPSWLRDGDGGLLVPRGDPTALAGALGSILGDAALRARLAAAGPAAAARFSLKRHLDALLPELEAVAG